MSYVPDSPSPVTFNLLDGSTTIHSLRLLRYTEPKVIQEELARTFDTSLQHASFSESKKVDLAFALECLTWWRFYGGRIDLGYDKLQKEIIDCIQFCLHYYESHPRMKGQLLSPKVSMFATHYWQYLLALSRFESWSNFTWRWQDSHSIVYVSSDTTPTTEVQFSKIDELLPFICGRRPAVLSYIEKNNNNKKRHLPALEPEKRRFTYAQTTQA